MTKLCAGYDCIADMEWKAPRAKFCSDECRHRHWQHVNRVKRNEYQKEWRDRPARRPVPYAGQQKDSRHG